MNQKSVQAVWADRIGLTRLAMGAQRDERQGQGGDSH